MSMGPTIKKEEVFKEKVTTKVSRSAKKAAEVYFRDPAYYLFHFIFFAIATSLIFHVQVYPQLYLFLLVAGILSFATHDLKKEDGKRI